MSLKAKHTYTNTKTHTQTQKGAKTENWRVRLVLCDTLQRQWTNQQFPPRCWKTAQSPNAKQQIHSLFESYSGIAASRKYQAGAATAAILWWGYCQQLLLTIYGTVLAQVLIAALIHHHHRLYSPAWALASSSKCRQRPLPWASARQLLQPSFLASPPTPSIHLDFGQ
jgi:hypothetical protein